MFRLRPVRSRRALRPLPLRVVDAGFGILLVFAFAIGGSTAWSGLSRYGALLFPPGMMAAQARGEISTAVAQLSLGERVTAHVPEAIVDRRPAIAIVIDDLGEDLAGTDRALQLPAQVTLSFLPFAEDTHWLAPAAVAQGHEVLAHVPMESIGGSRAGPLPLTLDLSVAEIARRLDWALDQVPGRIGINNHEGSRFTADAAALAPVMQALAARDMFFFDSRTAATSQVVPVARANGVASAARDIFLDDTVSAQEIAAQLQALEDIARNYGVAIAIGHPHDVTLTALAGWTQTADQRGFNLVSLSEAIRRKSLRETALAAR